MGKKSNLQMDISSKTGVFLNDIVNLIDPSVIIRLFSVLALFGFAFPFVTVSCANSNAFSLNGFDMIMGKRISFVSDSMYISPQPLIIMLAVVCVVSVITSVIAAGNFMVFLSKFASFTAIGVSLAQILSFDFMANTYKRTFFGDVFIDLNVTRGLGLFYIPIMHAICLIFIFKQKSLLMRKDRLSNEASVYDSILKEIESGGEQDTEGEYTSKFKPIEADWDKIREEANKLKSKRDGDSSLTDAFYKMRENEPSEAESYTYKPVRTTKSNLINQKSAGKIVQRSSDESKVFGDQGSLGDNVAAVPQPSPAPQSEAVPAPSIIAPPPSPAPQPEAVPAPSIIAPPPLQISVPVTSTPETDEINSFISSFDISVSEDQIKSSEAAVESGWSPFIYRDYNIPKNHLELEVGFISDSVQSRYKEEISRFNVNEDADFPAHIKEIKNVSDRYRKEMQDLLHIAKSETAAAYQEALDITSNVNLDDNTTPESSIDYFYEESLLGGTDDIPSSSVEPVNEMVFDSVNNLVPAVEVKKDFNADVQKNAANFGMNVGVSFKINDVPGVVSSTVPSVSPQPDVGNTPFGFKHDSAVEKAIFNKKLRDGKIKFISSDDGNSVATEAELQGRTSQSVDIGVIKDSDGARVNGGDNIVTGTKGKNFTLGSSLSFQSSGLNERIKNAKMNFAKKLSSDIKNSSDKNS